MAQRRKAITTSYHNLITFIPGTQQRKPDTNEHTAVKTSVYNAESEKQGHEARSFYENLLKQDTHCNKLKVSDPSTVGKISKTRNSPYPSKGSVRRKNEKASVCDASSNNYSNPGSGGTNFSQLDPKTRQHYKLLQLAQVGNVSNMRDLLRCRKNEGLDVNFSDFYGWTPLMCSAKEGHVNAVKFLLKCGANKSICNSSGDTALSIARNAGHLAVVSFMESHGNELHNGVKKESRDDSSTPESFHCDLCKRDFSQKEKANHLTSTVHLFNSGHRSNAISYFLTNSNRGYQMLLRSGWDAQSGLGPDGKGRKYPVKTVLKQDRAGIGGEEEKQKRAKVTHFTPGDMEAVKSNNCNPSRVISVRKAARNAVRFKEKRDRRWEQNLRFEMS